MDVAVEERARARDAGLPGRREDAGEEPASAASRWASSNTMFALLPPSSSVTGARRDRRSGRDLLSRRLAAGERDLRDAGVVDQRAARLARAGDDVDDARREARLLGEAQRLEHARTARAPTA